MASNRSARTEGWNRRGVMVDSWLWGVAESIDHRAAGVPWLDPRLTFALVDGFDFPELLSATAWRTSALKADAFTSSPSWMSIARRVFPSRLELKRWAGAFRDAPLAKVSFTTCLYDSPVQMMPSCDHTGVPGL